MNPNKINIQDRFARFLVRNMTPTIAGTNWNEDNIEGESSEEKIERLDPKPKDTDFHKVGFGFSKKSRESVLNHALIM
mgnify:CR=1 FL=1